MEKKEPYETYGYSHLIYDKSITTVQWVQNSLFKEWCWDNVFVHIHIYG